LGGRDKKGSQREANPQIHYREFKRGEAPLSINSPSPLKERGIKGVR